MILHFIRHGLPDDAEGRCLGHADHALSAEGAAALRELARSYASPPEALVSSDLARARDSARALGAAWGMEPVTTSAIREMNFGAWDGRRWSEIELDDGERMATWMGEWSVAPAPNGESFPDVARRVGGWLDALLASGADGTVVIVAHSGSIRAALCHLFGVPLSEVFKVRIDYGRVSAVHIGPRGQELICLNAITAP